MAEAYSQRKQRGKRKGARIGDLHATLRRATIDGQGVWDARLVHERE